MILNVSERTDIVAFYTEWFMNRYHKGYVDVCNPFNPKLVSRIYFEDVDVILFCTKNPMPILPYLRSIDKPILFHVALTSYNKDIEPNVPNKKEIIEAIKKLSSIIGIDNLVIRYDPILLNDKYDISYHIKAFDKLCSLLEGYVKKIIISFVDDYKNVRNNMKVLRLRDFNESDYKDIGVIFSNNALKHGMTVQTCFEEKNLEEYGFIVGECISHELAYTLTGKKFPNWKARKERKCNCVEMADIGVYNSCKHFCRYCYANYDENKVIDNFSKHDPNSSMLIGNIQSDDVIKVRKNRLYSIFNLYL